MGRPPIPIKKGDVFGKLTVLADRVGADPWAVVQCACGSPPKRVRVGALTSRKRPTRSCGCAMHVGGVARHGHATKAARTATYRSWRNLLRTPAKVCVRWRRKGTGFPSFLADLGERPAGMVLERIDPGMPYEPGNVRWAEQLDQSGERNGRATLSAEDVREMRRLLESGTSRRSVAHRDRDRRAEGEDE